MFRIILNTAQKKAASVLLVGALLLGPLTPARAQEQSLTVQGTQPLRDSLQAKVGTKVALLLNGGQEISGKIVAVGDQAVHLSELTGKEFYDAVVRLEHISAVVLRVRDK